MKENTFKVDELSGHLFNELMMALNARKHQLTEIMGWEKGELDLSNPYSAASQIRRVEELEKRLESARYPEIC